MPQFSYTALTPKGKRHRGVVDAPTEQEAKMRLREQGVLLTALFQRGRGSTRSALKGQPLVDFTLQFAQLIRSGMPVFESLSAIEEQARDERFHPVIVRLCEEIKEGSSLSSAMSNQKESFNQLYTAMVTAGETSGSLEHALDGLAELLSRSLKLKKSVVAALTYPAIVGAFCLVVIVALLTFAIPSMGALFGDRKLPAFTSGVLWVSNLLSTGWPIYLPLLALTAALLYLLFRGERGGLLAHRWLMRTPLIHSLLISAAIARFSRTLASLQEGGVTMIDSLQLAEKTMMNPTLEAIIAEALRKVVSGSRLSKELKEQPLIPRLLVRMLGVGEESGNLVPMLRQIAGFFEGELEKRLTRITTLLQPAILIVMGAIVGVIMLAVLLPLTDVSALF